MASTIKFRSMNKLMPNVSSFTSSLIPSHLLYFSPNLIDLHQPTVSNRTLPLFQFNHSWIFPLFLLSILAILFTIIILFLLVYFSMRRLNDHSILTNLILCFSICSIYIIVIFFLVRGNELFCGLREFLSQFAYALLFSALLCRYIMQWLSTRILSKRTKQLTSLLLYSLLVFTQIPIGILWWYFTFPRFCQEQIRNPLPKFKFHFYRRISTNKSCSYQCIVDHRFYATYTYIILELFLCTIIGLVLFFYRYCQRGATSNDQTIKTNYNYQRLATIFDLFALILIDIIWLFWTFVYHFTQVSFVFPALIFGMFSIATITMIFILLPQVYYYSKNRIKNVHVPNILLYSNKLATTNDISDQDFSMQEKHTDRWNQNKQLLIYNESEGSYELGTSGTFLPITKTPKVLSQTTKTEAITPIEKLDELIYGENSPKRNRAMTSEKKYDPIETNVNKSEISPSTSQNQIIFTNTTTDLIDSNLIIDPISNCYSNVHPPSTSVYYSSCLPTYRDETFVPILCSAEQHPPSTPVKMRIMIRSPSSYIPTTRRICSGTDHRYVQQNPYPYSPTIQRQPHFFTDSYRLRNRYGYPYRRLHMEHRSLAQRLWDIDSESDQDEIEERTPYRSDPISPRKQRFSWLFYNDYDANNLYNNKRAAFV